MTHLYNITGMTCYDCHSDTTRYPMYFYIQPTRFLMESHIATGKKNLNFNEFRNYSSKKQNNKLDRIMKQKKSDDMPLSSYSLIYRDALLSNNQKQEVINWIQKTSGSISSKN